MLLAALSGILYALAFSVNPLWWVSFVALFPLLLSLDRSKTWKDAVLRISLFSVLCSTGMGYWLFNALTGHYQLFAGLAFCFFGMALVLPVWLIHLLIAVFYRFFNSRSLVFYALVVPCLWVMGDYVKSLIPLLIPWGDIGYALVNWPAYFQVADLGSVRLVSFFVVTFNSLLVCLIEAHPVKGRQSLLRQLTGPPRAVLVLLAIIIIIPVCYGAARRHQMSDMISAGEGVNAVIVQGNFSPEDRWGGLGFYQRLKTYIELSGLQAATEESSIIVWPETVLNHSEALTKSFFADLYRMLGEKNLLIAGGLKKDQQQKGAYNSVYLVGADQPLQRYDKHILLPYSERVPFIGPLFRFYSAPDQFLPGTTPTCLDTPHGRIGVSICFEILYPGYIRRSVKQGAGFLVNVSNDSWFGDSTMPHVHLLSARARAVETGRYLLRASNSGISALIAPDGSLAVKSGLFRAQQISGSFVSSTGTTVYTQWGDWLFFFLLAVLGVGFLRTGIGR